MVPLVVYRGRRVVFLRGAFMMAEKARLFQDCRAEELIMSSTDPSAHKRIGRGVRSFDNAVWDHIREDAVLAGNFAKSHRNRP